MAALRPETFADDLLEPTSPDSESSTGLREGLPPGFRMRHDAHYVDQLTSRSRETIVRAVAIKDIDRREAVDAALGPERRLSAVQFLVEIADPSLTVRADEKLLTVAVAGMLDATLALVRRMEEGRVVVRLIGRAAPPSMVLDVSQDAVTLPPAAVARFLDPQWTDRPGGMTAGIGLAAAQRVAELHGGRLDVSAGDRAGSHLTLIVPSIS